MVDQIRKDPAFAYEVVKLCNDGNIVTKQPGGEELGVNPGQGVTILANNMFGGKLVEKDYSVDFPYGFNPA